MKKILILGSLALMMAACSENTVLPDAPDNNPQELVEQPANTASYIVGQADQSRVSNMGYYIPPRTRGGVDYTWPAEMPNGITVPAGAVDITAPNYDQNKNIYVVPAGKEVDLNVNLNNTKYLYIQGTVKSLNGNFGNLHIYICNGGSLTTSAIYTGTINIYNEGTLNLGPYALQSSNIANIYNNGGVLNIGNSNNDWPNISNSSHIYSKDGKLTITGNTVDFKGNLLSNHAITIEGNLTLQNLSGNKNFCGLIVTGKLYVVDSFTASFIKAKTIELNGAQITLNPEGYVDAEEIIIPNSGCGFRATEGSHALVQTDKLTTQNIRPQVNGVPSKNIAPAFGAGVYLNVNSIDGDSAVNEFIVSEPYGINNPTVSGTPECGPAYGEPTAPPFIPRLVEIVEIESPNHDHNADKTAQKRHLSATSIDYNPADNTFYVSYHMRGSNWGNDQYDNDEIEGCIETWKFTDNNQIQVGKFMWTYEFDFNHLILDRGNVITVGHKGKIQEDGSTKNAGAIIGKLSNVLSGSNFGSTEGGQDITEYNDFQYKYLTTAERLETASGSLLDYANAGDGNCVIRVDDKYFVATSRGYGIVEASEDKLFRRVKKADDTPAFINTDGSAKYLVRDGNNVSVLHLNDRPAVTKDAKSPASIATSSIADFGIAAGTTVETPAVISPVDGKNVLAIDNGVVYACLGTSGLSIDGQIKTFGLSNPVNGVDVDDKYVYVANGCWISILDKNTKELVTERRANDPEVSANFVKVYKINNERIVFTAYGQEGIKVFKFVDEE